MGFSKSKFLANVRVNNPLQDALQDHMAKTGQTGQSIAQRVGCPNAMIVHYKSGKNIPSLPVFCKLATKVLSETQDILMLVMNMSKFYDENGGRYKTKNVKMEDVDDG